MEITSVECNKGGISSQKLQKQTSNESFLFGCRFGIFCAITYKILGENKKIMFRLI